MISKLTMALNHMHSVENGPEILIFSQAGNIPNNIPTIKNSIGS